MLPAIDRLLEYLVQRGFEVDNGAADMVQLVLNRAEFLRSSYQTWFGSATSNCQFKWLGAKTDAMPPHALGRR